MKIRHGFVSNSSSTSFTIFGVNRSDIIDKISDILYQENNDSANDDNLEDNLESQIEDILRKLSLKSGMFYGYEDRYIGRSWDEIEDDENGKQFKESVKNDIRTILKNINDKFENIELNFDYFAECYHD